MLSFILITVAVIILIEMMNYLNKEVDKYPLISINKATVKLIKSLNQRTVEEQAKYAKAKIYLQKAFGTFFRKVALTILYVLLFVYVHDLKLFNSWFYDMFLIVTASLLGSIVMYVCVNSHYKEYTLHYYYWLYFFIFTFAVIQSNLGFKLFGHNLGLLLMLPYFLLVRIIYNNLRCRDGCSTKNR